MGNEKKIDRFWALNQARMRRFHLCSMKYHSVGIIQASTRVQRSLGTIPGMIR